VPKRTLVAILVCVNLALLTAVCLAAYTLPSAIAQDTGLSGNYLVVAGEIQDEHDALYVLDRRERTLHAFYWDMARRQLVYADWRDLDRDIRHNRE